MEQFGKKTPAVGLAIVLDQLMNALGRQKADIPTDENGVLVLYHSAQRKTAIHTGNRYRDEGRRVMLMRKNAETALDEYRQYAEQHQIATVLYVESDESVKQI